MVYKFLTLIGLSQLVWAGPRIWAHARLKADLAQSICGDMALPNGYNSLIGSCDTACYMAICGAIFLGVGATSYFDIQIPNPKHSIHITGAASCK
jgi:hypothetical protein